MTAKQYLKRIKAIDDRVKRYTERIKALRASADGLKGIAYDGIKVQTSPADTMPDRIGKIADLERLVVREIISLEEAKVEAVGMIHSIDYRDGEEVLYLRWVEGLSFYDISDAIGHSLRQVHRIHGRALQMLNEKLAQNVT